MELSLFDLHCDTAYEMHRQKQPLSKNTLAVSLDNAKPFKQYIQVMALWTDHTLSDESGWSACQIILSHLKADEAISHQKATLVDHCPTLPLAVPSLMLGVEDARILCGREARVETLWSMGVRFLTPLWKGETCIGGSHDTAVGLTAFGKRAIQKAIALGMIMDISHASEKSADEMFALSSEYNRPIIATHSNSYDICPASRNLHRWQVEAILHCNGVVGLNLYPPFLNAEREAHLEDILAHIEYFLELGLERNLCLGCDMDGATLPPEIQNLSELPRLAELLLRQNYTEDFVHNLFFENAYRFVQNNLK